MKDFCGSTMGLRVSKEEKTVHVIWKSRTEWKLMDESRRYPLSPDEIPSGIRFNGTIWDLAWSLLRIADPEKARALETLLTTRFGEECAEAANQS